MKKFIALLPAVLAVGIAHAQFVGADVDSYATFSFEYDMTDITPSFDSDGGGSGYDTGSGFWSPIGSTSNNGPYNATGNMVLTATAGAAPGTAGTLLGFFTQTTLTNNGQSSVDIFWSAYVDLLAITSSDGLGIQSADAFSSALLRINDDVQYDDSVTADLLNIEGSDTYYDDGIYTLAPGDSVTFYVEMFGDVNVSLDPVPEPFTMALAGLGLAAAARMRRRK